MNIITAFGFFFLVSVIVQESKADWRWAGKVAVITGASSGIGSETAVELANRGMVVVGLARRETLIKELSKMTNGTIYAIKCDLLNETEVLSAFRWIETTLGGVDVLVNNAGVAHSSSLLNSSTAEWRQTLELNVISLSICTREALRTMRTRGDDGYIININSIAGHEVLKIKGYSSGMYSPSKFSVTAISELLAFELSEQGSRIKVTNLSPGFVITEMTQKFFDSYKSANSGTKSEWENVPNLDPTDIADAIVSVLSLKPHIRINELTITSVLKSKA